MPKSIENLIKGYKVFRQKYFVKNSELFNELVRNGQSPTALVVSCSDSRVDPSILMNCQPGDLFVIRNVANLIPPCEDKSSYHGTSAAIEFSVCKLGIKHIILLGHSQCGGIASLFNHTIDEKEDSFIAKWMEIAKTAKTKTNAECSDDSLDHKVNQCAKHSLINSLKNLMTFPWVSERVARGELSVNVWYFNIEKGLIENLDQLSLEFIEIE